MKRLNHTSTHNYYEIESARRSESALLLFSRHKDTGESIVIKKLLPYKDMRYSLETIDERQRCQLEALEWNRKFAPEVYLGLAPICNMHYHQESICIGKVIENPLKEKLETNLDYALLMDRLPDNRRLDNLLREKEEGVLFKHLQILIRYIREIHTQLAPSLSTEDTTWGSLEQLREKLQHNLELLDIALAIEKHGQQNIYTRLKQELPEVLVLDQYQNYFEQRIKDHQIKRCHGDLKATNIWIAPYNSECDNKPQQCVWLLDTIDFNPSYSNIDILSDFAMLVVDIQARAKSVSLANRIIEEYMQLTEQQNQITRSVLAYYLVEKAIVGAAISITFDNLPELGNDYLEVAMMRLDDLKSKT